MRGDAEMQLGRGPTPPPPFGTPKDPGSVRPREAPKVVTRALTLYLRLAPRLIPIAAVVVVPMAFLRAAVVHALSQPIAPHPAPFHLTGEAPRGLGPSIAAGLVGALFAGITSGSTRALTARSVTQAEIGDPADVFGSMRWGARRLGSVLLVSVVAAALYDLGLRVFVVPGVIA